MVEALKNIKTIPSPNNSTLTNSHTKTKASSIKHLTYHNQIPCPQTVHTYLIHLFIVLNMGLCETIILTHMWGSYIVYFTKYHETLSSLTKLCFRCMAYNIYGYL